MLHFSLLIISLSFCVLSTSGMPVHIAPEEGSHDACQNHSHCSPGPSLEVRHPGSAPAFEELERYSSVTRQVRRKNDRSIIARQKAHPDQKPVDGQDGGPYKLHKKYKGRDFMDPDQWDYFDKPDDPTHGFVAYQPLNISKELGLARVDEDGSFWMKVDDETDLSQEANPKRKSVRISSKAILPERALLVGDFKIMPYGCSVWPAYWTLGAGDKWPDKGEVDILENVHNAVVNQVTYHTTAGCSIDPTAKMASKVLTGTCEGHTGCGVTIDTKTKDKSFGKPFNEAGGGVYAYLRTDDALKVWFFSRSTVPADIKDGKPDPSTWPTPVSVLKNGDKCKIDTYFKEHIITFDTTLCGDWAGDRWADSGCDGTCVDTVKNPENFKTAKWQVNYVAVYVPTTPLEDIPPPETEPPPPPPENQTPGTIP